MRFIYSKRNKNLKACTSCAKKLLKCETAAISTFRFGELTITLKIYWISIIHYWSSIIL